MLKKSFAVIGLSLGVFAAGLQAQTLSVDQTSLSFFAQLGGPAVSKTLLVSGSSAGISFNAVSNAAWLKLNPVSGSTPSTITVTADPTGFSAGTVSATITIAGGLSTLQVPVSLTVSTVGVSPQSLQFAYTSGGSFPTTQLLTLTGQSTSFTAAANTTTGGLWLQVAPTSGQAPGSISVAVNNLILPSLSAGTYNGSITITPASQPPIVVPVTLTVSAAPAVSVSPSSLVFNYQTGQAVPAAQNISISVTPAQQLNFSLSPTVSQNPAGKNWINIVPSGITAVNGTSVISVAVDPSGLPANTYTGKITVTSSGNPSPLDIPVTLVVSNQPLLNVPTAALNFSYQLGSATPPPQTVTVTATSGTPAFTISTSSNTSWLIVPASGNAPGPFSVSINPAGLAPGTYSGAITITGVGTGNGPQQIPVNLKVTNDPVVVTTIAGCTSATQNCSLVFPSQVGGTNNPGPQTVTISSSTGANLNYTATPSTSTCGNWLLLNGAAAAVSGSTTNSFTVGYTPGIAAGTTCSGSISIAATNASSGAATPNSPLSIPVMLIVTSAAQLVVAPQLGLTFTLPAGGQSSVPQTISLASTGTDQLNWAVTFTPDLGGNWLSLNAASGVTPGSLTVTATPSGLLAAGTYTGNLKITATGPAGAAADTPFVIPVTLQLTSGTLVLSPTSLTFSQALGGSAPAAQTVQITSNGQPLTYSVAASNPGSVTWLSVTGTTTGQTPGTVSVSVDGSKLSPGNYQGFITITAPGASNTPATLPVTLNVTAGSISAAPTSLTFTQAAGGSAPAPQAVNVTGTPGAVGFTVGVSAANGGTWLSATPASGTTPGLVTVSASAGSLAVGQYTGTVTITAPTASGSPISIPVTLNVVAAQTLTATPASLNFNFTIGTSAPAAQQVQVATTGSNIAFSAAAATKDGANWLAVTPASGNTPGTLSVSVSPQSLAAGNYTGTVTISSPNSASPATVAVSLTVLAIPKPVVNAIGNAANYVTGAVSPGENIVIFGAGIGPATIAPLHVTNGIVDNNIGNTRVLFDGIPAPMIYALATQTSVMVPYGLAGRTSTSVVVEFQGVQSAPITYNVVPASPGIYTLNQQGNGPGAILNQDLSVNGANNAAAKGSVVAVYMTGEGQTIGNVDGGVATTLKNPVLPVTATVGGVAAAVQYAGTAIGLVNGVMQVNVLIPAGAPSGSGVPIVITAGTAPTQPGVTVAIQ